MNTFKRTKTKEENGVFYMHSHSTATATATIDISITIIITAWASSPWASGLQALCMTSLMQHKTRQHASHAAACLPELGRPTPASLLLVLLLLHQSFLLLIEH